MKNQYVPTDDEDTDSAGSRQHRVTTSPKGLSSSGRIVLLRRPEKNSNVVGKPRRDDVSSFTTEANDNTPQATSEHAANIAVAVDTQEKQDCAVSSFTGNSTASNNGLNSTGQQQNPTLEERELAYQEARKRIFGTSQNDVGSFRNRLNGIDSINYRQTVTPLNSFRNPRPRAPELERLQYSVPNDVSTYYPDFTYTTDPRSSLIVFPAPAAAEHQSQRMLQSQYQSQILYQEQHHQPCYAGLAAAAATSATMMLPPSETQSFYPPPHFYSDVSQSLPLRFVTSYIPTTTDSESHNFMYDHHPSYNVATQSQTVPGYVEPNNQRPFIQEPSQKHVQVTSEPITPQLDNFCEKSPRNVTEPPLIVTSPPAQPHTTKSKLSSYDIDFPPLDS